MVKIKFQSLIDCSMANEEYQEVLRQLVKEVIDDLIDDAVGLAEWKMRQKGNNPTQGQYGTAEFPSDCLRSLTFNDLAGTQPTDNEDDQNKSDKDGELVKYLIGEISESKDEKPARSKSKFEFVCH